MGEDPLDERLRAHLLGHRLHPLLPEQLRGLEGHLLHDLVCRRRFAPHQSIVRLHPPRVSRREADGLQQRVRRRQFQRANKLLEQLGRDVDGRIDHRMGLSALTSQVLTDQLLLALGDGHEHRAAQQCLAVGPQHRVLLGVRHLVTEASPDVEHLFLGLEAEIARGHRVAAIQLHAVVVLLLVHLASVPLERCVIRIRPGLLADLCFHCAIPPLVLLKRLHLANLLVLGQLVVLYRLVVLKLRQLCKLCLLLIGHGRNALDRPLTR